MSVEDWVFHLVLSLQSSWRKAIGEQHVSPSIWKMRELTEFLSVPAGCEYAALLARFDGEH